MKPLVLAITLSLLALATPAVAQTSAAAPAETVERTKLGDPDQVICRDLPVEGTRFLKRTCLTRAAWKDQETHRQARQAPPGYSPPEGPMLYAPSAFGPGVPMQ